MKLDEYIQRTTLYIYRYIRQQKRKKKKEEKIDEIATKNKTGSGSICV